MNDISTHKKDIYYLKENKEEMNCAVVVVFVTPTDIDIRSF